MPSRYYYCKILVLTLSILVSSACSDNSSDTTAIAPSDTPAMDVSNSLQDQLQDVVDKAVESGLPGVSLHLQHGEESMSIVAGVANRDTGELVTPESLFQIASIGKTFVATMFVRFADMGLLQLDDPIANLLDPNMSALLRNSDTITVEMLLAHTSGLPEYVASDTNFVVDYLESPDRVWTAIEVLDYITDKDNLFEPGASFTYSNTNYLILGVIAERVTSEALGTALRNWVFQPTGLSSTYGTFEEIERAEIAHGYMPASFFADGNIDIDLPADGSDVDTFRYISTYGFGDAPILSTPKDMNSFIRDLIDTDILLSGESKARMLTESFPGLSRYGYGIVVAEDATVFGHDGQHFGLTTSMLYIPAQDLSFATAVNASDGSYNAILTEYINQLTTVLEDNTILSLDHGINR